MTGPISNNFPSQIIPDTSGKAIDQAAAGQTAAGAGKAVPAPPPPAPPVVTQEAVTLSASAQATTQLFQAARESDGIDQAGVDRLRAAVQSGTYDVQPENLATALVAALRQNSP